ncbi:major facilitator superfamily domain-containing protein [Mycena vulgaris]|nr:major facilitator superfamily domain-containing protein [Mycena vulgaris]
MATRPTIMADQHEAHSGSTTHEISSGVTLPKQELDSIASSPPPPVPEGGVQAWATVAGAFLVQFCGFGYSTSFGVYQDFYTRDYLTQSSSSAISWIGSINTSIIFFGGLIAGRLHDRGYFYYLLYGGSILLCFSLFMLSLCQPEMFYQILLAQGIGAGLGTGTIYIPSLAIVSQYFQRRRALAMSIVASGSALGAVVHPIMLNNTIRTDLGFGNAVRASAGLVSGLLVIACLLMHPRVPPSPIYPPFWKSLRRFARDRAYIFATVGMTTFTMGFYFPIFYLQLDAVKHGINETVSFYSLVIMNVSNVVGRLSPGPLAHRLGVINMIAASAGCSAILILCMIALKSVASVVLIGVLCGFFSGVYVTLTAPLIAVLTEDVGELGCDIDISSLHSYSDRCRLRMGVSFFVVGIGALVGPPINGALLTSKFIWWRPALFSGLMALVGFAFLVATRIAVGQKLRT